MLVILYPSSLFGFTICLMFLQFPLKQSFLSRIATCVKGATYKLVIGIAFQFLYACTRGRSMLRLVGVGRPQKQKKSNLWVMAKLHYIWILTVEIYMHPQVSTSERQTGSDVHSITYTPSRAARARVT